MLSSARRTSGTASCASWSGTRSPTASASTRRDQASTHIQPRRAVRTGAAVAQLRAPCSPARSVEGVGAARGEARDFSVAGRHQDATLHAVNTFSTILCKAGLFVFEPTSSRLHHSEALCDVRTPSTPGWASKGCTPVAVPGRRPCRTVRNAVPWDQASLPTRRGGLSASHVRWISGPPRGYNRSKTRRRGATRLVVLAGATYHIGLALPLI